MRLRRPDLSRRADEMIALVFALGIYTAAPLPFAALSVPAGFAFLLTPLLYVRSLSRVTRREARAVLVIPFCWMSLAGLQSVIMNNPLDIADSYGLLAASFLMGYGWFRFCRARLVHLRLESVVVGALCVLLAGTLFEVVTPQLRSISDDFRQAAFSAGRYYVSDARDIALHGAIRPKLFTSEPSHLAKYIALLIVCWFTLTCRRGAWMLALAAMAVGYALIRSPTLLVVAPAFVAVARWHPKVKIRRRGAALVACGLLVVVVFAAVRPSWLLPGAERVTSIAGGDDGSFEQRFFGAADITGRSVFESPAFGNGVGEVRNVEVVDVSYAIASGTADDEQLRSVANVTFGHWISFGIIGGAVLVCLYWRLLRVLCGRGAGLSLGLSVLFGMSQGGYNGPRFWFMFFFIAACSLVVAQREQSTPSSGSGVSQRDVVRS